MKIIKGSLHPKAEEKTFYELSNLINDFGRGIFDKKPEEKLIWTLYKNVDKKWKKIEGNIKEGQKVPYTFGEKVVGIPYKIVVHSVGKHSVTQKIETTQVADLVVTPRTTKEPVIGRVILLNRENSNVNKAKFNESLSAEARTSNMFNKEITFYLWEDGTAEKDRYKKPKSARVDKNGIAKVKFNLSEYATPETWTSFFTGDKNTTKKFFVTAEYLNKEVTNKGAVIVSDGNSQPAPTTNKQGDGPAYTAIQKMTELVAEGLGKIGDYFEETKAATSVNKTDVAKKDDEEKGKCYCNRDFEADEFEKIIHELRDSELAVKKDSGYALFAAPNCKLKAEDKTINKLRDHINSIFNEYGINTCIRKLHFLAQIYHETDRLRTTLEYATNKNYKPYFGRGLMQLTWESNYYVYKDYRNIDCVTNFEIIEKNFYYACDSAGWFWKKGKVLEDGKRWKGPADAPNYVKIQKPDYPKTTITYKKGNTTIKYGTVDMGLIADDDKVDLISYLVNGGANGIQERRNYVITLKNIFQYPNICINKKKEVPKSDNDNEVTLHFTGKSAKEDALSTKTKKILKEVGKASGNYDIYITSTARTPYDQARIMYDNCKSDLAEQRRTYAPPGQKVIDVYVNNKAKPRGTVIKLMEQKINELGPSTVSKHLANPEFLNTFDVSYGNLTDKTKFWNEMKKRPELDDILNENKCYHIQINQ